MALQRTLNQGDRRRRKKDTRGKLIFFKFYHLLATGQQTRFWSRLLYLKNSFVMKLLRNRFSLLIRSFDDSLMSSTKIVCLVSVFGKSLRFRFFLQCHLFDENHFVSSFIIFFNCCNEWFQTSWTISKVIWFQFSLLKLMIS